MNSLTQRKPLCLQQGLLFVEGLVAFIPLCKYDCLRPNTPHKLSYFELGVSPNWFRLPVLLHTVSLAYNGTVTSTDPANQWICCRGHWLKKLSSTIENIILPGIFSAKLILFCYIPSTLLKKKQKTNANSSLYNAGTIGAVKTFKFGRNFNFCTLPNSTGLKEP